MGHRDQFFFNTFLLLWWDVYIDVKLDCPPGFPAQHPSPPQTAMHRLYLQGSVSYLWPFWRRRTCRCHRSFWDSLLPLLLPPTTSCQCPAFPFLSNSDETLVCLQSNLRKVHEVGTKTCSYVPQLVNTVKCDMVYYNPVQRHKMYLRARLWFTELERV